MKVILLVTIVCNLIVINNAQSQVPQYDIECSTPNLDSATAVALPYYGNNQVLENYLSQNGYNSLEYISFPSAPLRTTSSAMFLEPRFLIPINIFVYRDAADDPNSSINEIDARRFVCMVNEIFRDAGAAIQFYTNRVEFEANNFFNNQISTVWHVYDLWSRKRYIPDNSKGINVHFIRNNISPEDASGMASLPHYPVPPFAHYSLYVRTHINPSGGQRTDENIAGTLAHEIGHTLGLLHTHHPGRLPSLVFNEENGTISNGCYQEAVRRTQRNYFENGCFATHNKLKCEINGDFLCDTEGDPRQSDNVNAACNYIHPANGDHRVDNWNTMWTPPTRNVMSYTLGGCRDEFSRGQIGIMWQRMPHLKNYFDYVEPHVAGASSNVCFSSTRNLTLTGTLPNDAAITWRVEPASLVNISSGTGSVASLSASSSTVRGTANIIFTIIGANDCYIARLKKSFRVGPPASASSVLVYVPGSYGVNPVTLARESLYTFQISSVSGATSYTWTLPSGFSFMSGQGTSGSSVKIWTSGSPGTYTLKCSPRNVCGSSGFKSLTISLPGSSGGGGDPGPIPCPNPPCSVPIPHSFPNPANEELVIDFTGANNTDQLTSIEVVTSDNTDVQYFAEERNANTQTYSEASFLPSGTMKEVFLYNDKMMLVFHTTTTDDLLSLSTARLPEGIYILHTVIGEETFRQKIMVSHK